MTETTKKISSIPVDRIFLNYHNPRHEPYESQAEVIEYLCKDEYVYELAKDIAKHGLNPLEPLALIPEGGGKGKLETYYVAEGNRRMCAIKLLNDPELAPAKRRKDFEKIAEEAQQISEVQAIAFDGKEAVKPWLGRIHGGVQGGIGRKPWNAEQKTRHIGDTKNILAQAILDYAVEKKLISSDDRKGKLTTVQRYLSNPLLREALGVDNSNIEDIARNRPKEDFDLLLGKFLKDLKSGKVNSRSKARERESYSRELSSMEGLTNKKIEPESLSNKQNLRSTKKKNKSTQELRHPKKIRKDENISEKLNQLSNQKLQSVYHSICSINLKDHTCIISIAVWAFLECLTALADRDADKDFYSFLSKERLQKMDLGDGKETRALRQVIKRLSEVGNTTKHHPTAANFNGPQLYNDMVEIGGLILALCDEIKNKENSK